MSEDPDHDLYILRERATCSICKEFYTRPRKLSCCHVLCFDCIKRHVSLWRHSNFPPCPLCRKPIRHLDVNKLEPALAEQDIVSIVRKYEACDICKRKKNPNIKCLECKYLICKNCRPCHEEYNPLHTVVTILTSQKKGNHVSASRCDKHPDQYLTLYCIMCSNVLCSYCEKHLHKGCATEYSVCKRFERGLLHEYANSSNAVKPLGGYCIMPACLYLQDFSAWSLNWLEKTKKEIEQCVHFLNESRMRCNVIKNTYDDNIALSKRRDSILTELDSLERIGRELQMGIEKLLHDTLAADIAKSVLSLETQCTKFCRICLKYAHNIIGAGIRIQNISSTTSVLTLTCNITLVPVSGMKTLFGIYTVNTDENEEDILIGRHRQVVADPTASLMNTRANADSFAFDTFVAAFHDDSYSNENEKTNKPGSFLSKTSVENYLHRRLRSAAAYSGLTTTPKGCSFVNNVDIFMTDCPSYEPRNSKFRVKADEISMTKVRTAYCCTIPPPALEDMQSTMCVREELDLNFLCSVPVSSGGGRNETVFVALQACPETEVATKSLLYFTKYGLDPNCSFNTVITNFVNLITLEHDFCRSILYDDTKDTTIQNVYSANVDFILGNTKEGSGLAALLFHRKPPCVFINVPRIKLYSNYQRQLYSCSTKSSCIKDENGSFCVFWTTDEHNNCQLVYRSVRSDVVEFENSFVLHGDNHEWSLLKKTYLIADLLCNLKQGLMFVSRGCDLDEILIGKIVAMEKTIDIRIVFTLHQKSVGIQIEKLVPLTMIENRDNELLVLCAKEGENDKLAMIWPEKTGSDVLEILEVKYPSAEFANASIVDIQIDLDGNIMYVLENEDGKSCCACTRYFMPGKETLE